MCNFPTIAFLISSPLIRTKGRFFANVFIHFEPTGHTLRHSGEEHGGDVHEKYVESVSKRQGGHENDHSGLPPYIKDGTLEAERWRQRHPDNNRVSLLYFNIV